MVRNRILLVSAGMLLALIGLIVLQVSWISNDLALRREQFGRQVNTALNAAVNRIQTGETVQIITQSLPGLVNDTIVQYFSNVPVVVPLPPDVPVTLPDDSVWTQLDAEQLEQAHQTVTFVTDSAHANHVRVVVSDNSGKLHEELVSARTDLEAAKASMEEVRAEMQKVKVRRLERQHASERKRYELDKLEAALDRMAAEYERRDIRLAERVHPEILDSVVHAELGRAGVTLPYSLVMRNGSDSVLFRRSLASDPEPRGKLFEAPLFPGDFVNRGDRVQILFADTFAYFISSMWLRIASSALFTLTIIVVFTYTMRVILKQKKLSEMKNDFINNMTHEFKTPIATIRLAAESLMNPAVYASAGKVNYYTGIIRDENERMNHHVENILQLAQFDKNGFQLEQESVDLHQLLEESLADTRLMAEEKQAVIEKYFGTAPATVRGDRQLLRVVVTNLLDNALKYTSEKPVIRITTRVEDHGVTLEVSDNGIGMTPATQQHIFEKFYRVPTGNIHKVKGFGLGLNYAKAIVTAHHGTISVTSAPGAGSTFVVFLPGIQNS